MNAEPSATHAFANKLQSAGFTPEQITLILELQQQAYLPCSDSTLSDPGATANLKQTPRSTRSLWRQLKDPLIQIIILMAIFQTFMLLALMKALGLF